MGVGWLQYTGLWSLVIAWPAYQNIASGPEALTTLGARRLDLALVVVMVSLLAPTVITLVEGIIQRLFGARAGKLFRAVILGSLIALFAWQYLNRSDSHPILTVLIPLAIWAAAAFLYLRSEFIRNFTGILSLAIPVVIVVFCLRYPIKSEVLPHKSPTNVAGVKSHTPVVEVVLDELPLATLENRSGKIDSTLFPGFGRLAAASTWYPDTTTVADHTTVAVPSILSGKTPENLPGDTPLPPGLPDYPDTVCSGAADGGYKIFAYEPITDLCDRTYGLGTRVTNLVYRGVTTGDDLFPTGIEKDISGAPTKLFHPAWGELDSDRDDAIDYFIGHMPGTEHSFSMLHIVLPHVYWEYMPDGTIYTPDPLNRFDNVVPTGKGDATHLMQQMLLQLSYTDHQLSRIIDRMKRQGVWNRSLFVVTADHGASFIPGSNRRTLTSQNLGWVLPVPLFIKYPHQRSGKVVHGPADIRDITPTIFDVLGGESSIGDKGSSLRGLKSIPPRKRLDVQGFDGPMKPAWRKVQREFRRARTQKNETFSEGRMFALGGHRNLIGKRPDQVRGLVPVTANIDGVAAYRNVDPSGDNLPSFLRTSLLPKPGVNPGNLAVALNGRIVATAETWPQSYVWMTAVNLPDREFRAGSNAIRFYTILPGKPSK